jgi:hypothetical protein
MPLHRSTMFGVGALLAPQIVHVMEVYTSSGMNVFYVAVGLSGATALMAALLPGSPRAFVDAKPSEAGGGAPEAAHAKPGQSQAAGTSESASGGQQADRGKNATGAEGREACTEQQRRKKWKLPFLAAALILMLANVSIELGE